MYRWSWRKLTGSLLGFSSSSCFTVTVQVPDVFTQMRWSVASSETRFIRWENKGTSVDTMRSKTGKLLSLIISQIDEVFCYIVKFETKEINVFNILIEYIIYKGWNLPTVAEFQSCNISLLETSVQLMQIETMQSIRTYSNKKQDKQQEGETVFSNLFNSAHERIGQNSNVIGTYITKMDINDYNKSYMCV